MEQAQIEDPSRTSLTITHRLSTIRSCGLIFVLDEGHTIECEIHYQIVA